jgi:hypothetical protein
VPVKKKPSLVEILAYKDSWRQGLERAAFTFISIGIPFIT